MPELTVGVDLGGTNIKVGLVTDRGEIVHRHRVTTESQRGPEAVAERICGACRDLLAAAGSAADSVRGVGVGSPGTIDIANASRRIKDSEIEACAAAGVTDIIEVQFGYDGIVFASDIGGNAFAFTPADWYKALAAQVIVDGQLVVAMTDPHNVLALDDLRGALVRAVTDNPAYPFMIAIPRAGYVTTWRQTWHVFTTNNADNYWTVALHRTNNDNQITSWTTAGGSPNTWILQTIDINASVNASIMGVYIRAAKHGAPGALSLGAPGIFLQ